MTLPIVTRSNPEGWYFSPFDRVSYVAARDGHLVDVLSYVQVNRLTPFVAILLNVGKLL